MSVENEWCVCLCLNLVNVCFCGVRVVFGNDYYHYYYYCVVVVRDCSYSVNAVMSGVYVDAYDVYESFHDRLNAICACAVFCFCGSNALFSWQTRHSYQCHHCVCPYHGQTHPSSQRH